MANLRRRDFLKLFGATLAWPVLRPVPPDEVVFEHPTGLGRVTEPSIWAFSKPAPGAAKTQLIPGNTVLKIASSVATKGQMPHNPFWHETRWGWVYSSWVQPVRRQLNKVVQNVPKEGFWAEVTMPYVALRAKPDDKSVLYHLLYYSSVHQVIAHVEDDGGQSWYQLRDDLRPGLVEYARAEGLRPIPPAEMMPISPFVQDKLIEVNIKQQMLYAYENGRLVFSTRCATGTSFNIKGLGWVSYRTPQGKFKVLSKRPSRHMRGSEGRSDFYDLPGVPFCVYFVAGGVAVHGAYWHNDFGRPRSHGCVNVASEAAKWIYLWSNPPAGYDALLEVQNGGMPVVVS